MKNSGAALAIVIVIMFAMFFLGIAIAAGLFSGVKLSGIDKNKTSAFYLAETGIERTLWRLSQDGDWSDSTPPDNIYTDETLGDGTYTVTLSGRYKSRLKVTSEGKVGIFKYDITAEIMRTAPPTNQWWHLDYTYRKNLTATNTATTVLPKGYTVMLQLDTASLVSANKMQSDGDDLRVLYWDGISFQELYRDLVNMNTTNTQIWFKTSQSIPASGNDSNYFIYYGNETIINPPNAKDRVYHFYDDFNRDDSSSLGEKWENPVGLSMCQVNNNQAELSSSEPDSYIMAIMPPVKNFIVSYRVYIPRKNIDGSLVFRTDFYGIPAYLNQMMTTNNSGRFYYKLTNTWQTAGPDRWSPRQRQWYNVKITVLDDAIQCFINDVLELDETDTNIDQAGQIGLYMVTNGSRADYDDIAVRMYQNPEPTVSGGVEEILDIATKPEIYY